jgi:phage terminase large subunit
MVATEPPPKKKRKPNKPKPDLLVTPAGFCEGILGYPKLYDWQCNVLQPFMFASGPEARLVQVAVMSPNEGGRSSLLVSGIATWWLALHVRGKVGITTADQKQLNEQILPALEINKQKMVGWHSVQSPYYRLMTPTGGRLIAFTTDDAGRVEGLHKGNDIESPLLWIIDEAKNVKQEIFTGVDRCSYNAKLLSSSPGLKRGTFFDAFTKNRAQYVAVSAGLKDCPHISKDKVDRIVATYGEEHPFTRSSVYGEFMSQDSLDRYILSDTDLRRCIDNPPEFKPGITVLFCDSGVGHDENVIVKRFGNKVEIVATWREANKEAAAGRFIREFVNQKVKAEQVFVDAADKELWDLVERGGWSIRRQNFGQVLPGNQVYTSWSAMIWLEGAAEIGRCEWILPNDEILFAELTTRQKKLNVRGKWQAEEKHELRKRGVNSPSRADSVLGAMSVQDYQQMEAVIEGPWKGWEEEASNQQDRNVLSKIGASAGYG